MALRVLYKQWSERDVSWMNEDCEVLYAAILLYGSELAAPTTCRALNFRGPSLHIVSSSGISTPIQTSTRL